MKKLISIFSLACIAVSLFSLPTVSSAYYQCGWRNGHKVCWHTHRHAARCYWVQGHWHHHVYVHGHKVCYY